MNKKVLLPIAYFPPILWTALVVQSNEILLEYWETFPKQTIRNRCMILSANGPLLLSIPVIRTNGNHSKTNEMLISKGEHWQMKHFRAIMSAYSKSPFFYYYSHHFERFFQTNFETLIDLNQAALELVLRIIKFNPYIIPTNEWLKEWDNRIDLRNYFDSSSLQQHEIAKPYLQVFSDRFAFQPNLSILDLLFNEGPSSLSYLKNLDLQSIQDKRS